MEDKEVWQNVSGSQVYIRKLDPKGNEKTEHVRPGQKITLTPLERRINEDRARHERGNVFRNGMLSDVRLIDTEEDVAELRENKNTISESELEDLFDLTAAKFKNRIKEIDSFVVVRRLEEYASREDTKATMAQMKAIETRKEELDPAPKTVRNDPDVEVPVVHYD